MDNLEEMDKFLETQPAMNHEEIENLNRPITSKEIESVIKTSQQTKVQDQMASLPHGILPCEMESSHVITAARDQ